MTMLIEAVLAAPLVGFTKRQPLVLHAVEMTEIIRAWPQPGIRARLATASCGTTQMHLLASQVTGEQGTHPVPWPPRARKLPVGYTRCVNCYEATGRPRPRSTWSSLPRAPEDATMQ